MKKLSYATVILLGFAAAAASSKADPLLVGIIGTTVWAKFNDVDPHQGFEGSTLALSSVSQSYISSETRDDYYVTSTGDTQISNDDGADVAKISFTGATSLSAQKTDNYVLTSSEMRADFSVTAPVSYVIQGDFKGEVLAGPIAASLSGSLLFPDSVPTAHDFYLEDETFEGRGVFHQSANLTDDGNYPGSVGLGTLTGILVPGIEYSLYEGYTMSEEGRLFNVSAFGSGTYSITFTRLPDDGTGGGSGGDGGSGGGGGGGGSTSTVPDSGSSAGLASLGMVVLAVIRRRC